MVHKNYFVKINYKFNRNNQTLLPINNKRIKDSIVYKSLYELRVKICYVKLKKSDFKILLHIEIEKTKVIDILEIVFNGHMNSLNVLKCINK